MNILKRKKKIRIMNIKDLCSEIDDERRPIKIYLKKIGKKQLTIIEGLPNPKSYLKDFKRRYACNGFFNQDINLQGDHTEEIFSYLENKLKKNVMLIEI